MATVDDRLRAASYVPKVQGSAKRPALYVVDDKRPAVVVNAQTCGVRAISRTGQTDRVNRYVAETFPDAKPLNPSQFSNDVEQVWSIPGGIIATTRNDWVGNSSAYTLILFKPDT